MEVAVSGRPLDEKKDGKYGKYDDWQVESAADTLLRAEEIKADKDLYPYVQECLAKKKGALDKITSIKDLKKKAQEKIAEPEDDDDYAA